MTLPLVTLLTDFGTKDVYAAVLKGVIACINPNVRVVDLTHQISPQNIAAARFNLMNACPYFPKGTIHVAVVDPGVGSQRRAVAIAFEGGFLVGPDNGILSGVLSRHPVKEAVELTHSAYWRVSNPSPTFHGRDIFAPVGAHLASGVPLSKLGNAIDHRTLVFLDLPHWTETKEGIRGQVQYVDQFGNAITNIPGEQVMGKSWSVITQHLTIPPCQTYSDRLLGQPLALIGSHGWLEIAVNGGDAHYQLRLDWGSPVRVVFHEPGTD